MCEFLKNGNSVYIKPKGADYALENGKVYELTYDRFLGIQCTLKEDLQLPVQLYTNEKEDFFIKRIITHFEKTDKCTTGVLLDGVKGTGKTITAKRLAIASNLPIIVISSNVPTQMMSKWFCNFSQKVCVLIDEVEKTYITSDLLSFLDGINQTCKKLVIMTSNNFKSISQYMKDRCSRIRYIRHYTTQSNIEFVEQIANTVGVKNKEAVIQFCKENINLPSIDNITSFINEVKEFEDEITDLNEIAEILNVETKNLKYKTTKLDQCPYIDYDNLPDEPNYDVTTDEID